MNRIITLNIYSCPVLFPCFLVFLLTFLLSVGVSAQTVSFTSSNLIGENLSNPTSLQFGPDGRLYVAQQNGAILVYTIVKNAPNNYQVVATEVINLIQQIPNHNDDGSLAPTVNTRQVTGLLVTGTPTNPVIYVTSSDPRIGGGFNAQNLNLDTNSGVISRLTWNGTEWVKLDLVRGLPRSEENHSINGLALDAATNTLYVAQGCNTNMGAPSNNFVMLPEYAYSTAILKVDLNAIGETTYDLPTLDDEDRTNINSITGFEDPYDPFGGNNGKNQAILVPNGPVQIYSPGWRNNYDIVITKAGKMYSFDNGPNAGWGGPPINCTNQQSEPGVTYCDVLIHVTGPGHYAGSPNPTRANRNNTFNITNPQSPIPPGMENPIECNYLPPGSKPGQISDVCSSTNGLCEYTASNFSNAMKGNLIAASFNGKLYRFQLNATGDALVPGGKTVLASNFGSTPLDVIAQGDNDIFPGTIWVVTYGSGNITIFEPTDAPSCAGDPNSMLVDSDGDGYKNGDETLNSTDPCSPASIPPDFDHDFLTDLLDPDDDNDGINDINDKFALDFYNGMNTPIPISLDFDNSDDGGIENWGFTGLMINGVSNYKNLYNPVGMTVGGAALKFTIDAVSEGEAFGATNTQENAFQFGVKITNTQWNYIVHTRIMGPYQGFTPVNYQSMGMFIGTGDQDNYLRIICHANNGAGGIQVLKEVGGVPTGTVYAAPILNTSYVDFFFNINPTTLMVQPSYSINGGTPINVGPPVSIPANWISPNALAVGIISSSNGPGAPFPATWDFIRVYFDQSTVTGNWYTINTTTTPTARHECAYVQAGDKFYLLGGRGIKPVQCYHPTDSVWASRSAPPVQIHHFQAVEFNGLIYAICAFTGNFPNETPLPNIYIYDPVADSWSVGPEIPANRRRGSAGCVVYNNKIYVVGGIQNGHIDGWVPWLDVFDPITNTWTPLQNAPRERDHFSVALVNGKIYCIGGRKTGYGGSTFNATVPEVDIYDIVTGTWSTLPSPSGNLPTPRAAASVAVLGNEILVIGGESGASSSAHSETEALNIISHTWRTLAPLNQGRHGTQAIVSNGGVFVAAGSKIRGNDEINSQEVFYFFNPTPPTTTTITKGNLQPGTTTKNFSLVLLADTVSSTINLVSTGGNQVLMINEISLSDSVNYRITNMPNLPLAVTPNQQVPLNIQFHPLSLGVKNAFIHIEHTGANGPIDIFLTGECVETIPCEEYPTEENGLLIVECEIATNRPANWKLVTDVSGYTGSGFLRYEGPEYLYTPGNQLIVYKVNINHPGRYRFQNRSRNNSSVSNIHNDYWLKFPHGGARKFQLGVDKGPLIGWFKVYQNHPNTWSYQTSTVEENPHDIYVDFNAPGTYEIHVSARANMFMLDRFILYQSPITEAQATTALPPASPISCIELPWYADNDADLFGNLGDVVYSVVQPAGYVLNNKDCDDNNPAVKPSAVEVQDGIDNNCNGVIDEGFGAPKALLVVGNIPLSSSDQAIKDRLIQLGFDVTVMTGAQATSLIASAMDLIFVSSTINSSDVGTKFTNLEVPLINCESSLMDDLLMTAASTSNFGADNNQTQIKLTGAPHPLAGSLTNGVIPVYNSLDKITWGKPEPAATIIARSLTDTTKIAIFGYENNTQMVSIKAPARRVGFFLNDLSASKLTNAGLTLLDAAIRWAANYNYSGATIGDALFVAGDTSLTTADLAVKTRLQNLGFNVITKSAKNAQPADANGKELIVISSTSLSTDINTKFTNVNVPLLNWEPALSDDLKMTSSSSNTNTGVNKIQILNSAHPLAGGLPAGQAIVYSANDNIIYSSTTGSSAIKIAATAGNANNISIYGYEEGAPMIGINAPARRVGFFLHDQGAGLLTSNGWRLFDAAVRWLTEGLNVPPAFNISGDTVATEDFVGTKTIYVNPLPPVVGEENQVPVYNLSPTTSSFVNVSFSPATGNVTFTAKPNASGSQQFTITADDGQSKNNLFSKTFTFTVTPVNDPPTFHVSGNISVNKNFSGTQTVTIIPDPVPANEAGQTVTYSLSPTSVPFANVSINSATGTVSITAKPDSFGFQVFTITANDGQTLNNTATQQFYLAVKNPDSRALCFNCGGSQYVSVMGDTFKSDYYFSTGTLTYTNENIPDFANTFDDFIFKSERNATTFSYNIPVANGVYKVRLYFAETYFGATGGNPTGGVGSRVFHVTLEGTQVLSYFDIFAQAGGAEKAIKREFSNVVVNDGMLDIQFNAVINKAKISGICIVPDENANRPPTFTISGNVIEVKNFTGTRTVTVIPDPVPPGEANQTVTYTLTPPAVSFASISFNSNTGQVDILSVPDATGIQEFTITANDGQAVNNTASKKFILAVNETYSRAFCWNCGGPQYLSFSGDTFRSDFYFSSGTFTYSNNAIPDIQNTYDDLVYRSERNGNSFSYNIPLPEGYYKVKLLFSEIYFGATGGNQAAGPGSRVFDVTLEGNLVLDNFDIYTQALGAERALIREFDSVLVNDGILNIGFEGVVNKAKVSGICVIPYTDNTPPAFNLSTVVLNLLEDFPTTETISVIPDPVPPSDSADVVTYTLSPSTSSLANVSINPTTGTVTITKIPNKNGSAVFTVTANDGRMFGTFSRSFTLNIEPVNDPPVFSLTSNVVLAKNFSPPVSIQVVPAPVPADEVGQVVKYSLSPPSANFATVTIDSLTGIITFSSINNAYGTQVFTVFADDQQPVNNVASQTFTLTVSPYTANQPLPVFVNCGGPQYLSLDGDTFKADNYYSTPSFAYTNNSIPDIQNTGDDPLFRTERYAGTLSYNIPVRNGIYNIKIYFAEIYYGATGGAPLNGGPGKRIFNIYVEDSLVKAGYDIWVAAGGAEKAVIETFNNVSINDSFVNIRLAAVVGNAKLSAIAIIPAPFDCNGEQNGSAYLNDCGICVGGSTGLNANEGKDCNGVCGGTAFINDCGICVGGSTGLNANEGKDCNGVCGGTAFINDCGICVGGTTGLNTNEGKDCNGVCGGTASLDDCGICSGGTTGLVPNANKDSCGVCFGDGSSCAPPPCVPNEVVSFTLMHAGTAGEIAPLTSGMTINKAIIGAFSIRANTCNGQNVGSVKFILNGSTIRTESAAPYAINGDSPAGNYIAWNPAPGNYTLTAIPYTGSGGTGTAGISETITFTIIDQPNTTDCAGVLNGTAFMNACGICVGGTTGLPANQGMDCNGTCNGSAYLNECGVCVGGTTGLNANAGKDCAGVCNGSASIDDCGICAGGTTGITPNADKDSCGVCFGDGSSCSGSACQPLQIVALTLIDANTDLDIVTMTNGMTINLAVTPSISVRANTCNNQNVGSVKFFLNNTLIKTENIPPYAVNGDSPYGNYLAWNVPLGNHTLTATPYSGPSGSGTVGISKTISFTVINQPNGTDCAGVTNGTAYVNECGICVGGTTGLPADQGKDCAGVCGGSASVNDCGICVGGTTGLNANAGKDCAGVCNGSASIDDCGICAGGTTGITPDADKDSCGVCFGDGSSCIGGPCAPLSVTSVTIVGICTSGDIAQLTEGMVINLAIHPEFSLRANVCSEGAVGSVKFIVNGTTVRVENTAPFAINGDSPIGCFKKWYVGTIPYTLTVIPYSGTGATGTEGPAYTVHFTIVNQGAKREQSDYPPADDQDIAIYPNPNSGSFTLEFMVNEPNDVGIQIFNHLGQIIYHESKADFTGELKENISLENHAPGIYYLKLVSGENSIIRKVVYKN
ncbi:MAG: hypothetical protein KatS3mg031_0751 [Chitinophagales bacterium]|nr:MAG: hypothetical protein KatS3mg031_0751 [Chitinophagales bacterium]